MKEPLPDWEIYRTALIAEDLLVSVLVSPAHQSSQLCPDWMIAIDGLNGVVWEGIVTISPSESLLSPWVWMGRSARVAGADVLSILQEAYVHALLIGFRAPAMDARSHHSSLAALKLLLVLESVLLPRRAAQLQKLYSTNVGASNVSLQLALDLALPVLRDLAARLDSPLSEWYGPANGMSRPLRLLLPTTYADKLFCLVRILHSLPDDLQAPHPLEGSAEGGVEELGSPLPSSTAAPPVDEDPWHVPHQAYFLERAVYRMAARRSLHTMAPEVLAAHFAAGHRHEMASLQAGKAIIPSDTVGGDTTTTSNSYSNSNSNADDNSSHNAQDQTPATATPQKDTRQADSAHENAAGEADAVMGSLLLPAALCLHRLRRLLLSAVTVAVVGLCASRQGGRHGAAAGKSTLISSLWPDCSSKSAGTSDPSSSSSGGVRNLMAENVTTHRFEGVDFLRLLEFSSRCDVEQSIGYAVAGKYELASLYIIVFQYKNIDHAEALATLTAEEREQKSLVAAVQSTGQPYVVLFNKGDLMPPGVMESFRSAKAAALSVPPSLLHVTTMVPGVDKSYAPNDLAPMPRSGVREIMVSLLAKLGVGDTDLVMNSKRIIIEGSHGGRGKGSRTGKS